VRENVTDDTAAHVSMLRILLATCDTAVDTLCAADNPVDAELLALLRAMTERTRAELLRLTEPFADSS
jgi:hypothetical protein